MASFGFRLLTRDDFPLLSHWFTQTHVARWWAADPSLHAIESSYGSSIDGTEPSQVFIASRDGSPLGLVQRYRWEVYPSYVEEVAPIITVPAHAVSIDYLVGPPEALRRGWGAQMLRGFVQMIWQDDPKTPTVVVPVHADNTASWRVLERTGFTRVASGLLLPDNPIDNHHHHIYRLDRPAPS